MRLGLKSRQIDSILAFKVFQASTGIQSKSKQIEFNFSTSPEMIRAKLGRLIQDAKYAHASISQPVQGGATASRISIHFFVPEAGSVERKNEHYFDLHFETILPITLAETQDPNGRSEQAVLEGFTRFLKKGDTSNGLEEARGTLDLLLAARPDIIAINLTFYKIKRSFLAVSAQPDRIAPSLIITPHSKTEIWINGEEILNSAKPRILEDIAAIEKSLQNTSTTFLGLPNLNGLVQEDYLKQLEKRCIERLKAIPTLIEAVRDSRKNNI